MALLLLRHGTAVPESVDASRPLSDEGRNEATWAANAVAAYLELPSEFMPRGFGGKCDVTVMHSGKPRAQQTADTLAEVLSTTGCAVTTTADAEALSPNAEPAAAGTLVAGAAAPLTVLVGHLPHLHKLAATLGIDVPEERFTPAGGLLLQRRQGAWKLAHYVEYKVSWWMRGVSFYVPSSKCACDECTCGDDCKCSPGSPGCDPCGEFQKAKQAD